MKLFNKSLKEYFNSAKIFMFVIFLLSIIQVILIILGYFPRIELVNISETMGIFKMNYLNPVTLIGLLEIIIVFVSGFYLVLKKKFKLRHNFISSMFLFVSTLLIIFFIPPILPQMPIIFKIINYGILLIANLVIFIIASLFGGILSLIYKKFT